MSGPAGETTIRVALVGCGAIAEQAYLPVLRRMPGVIVTCVVDVDRNRARSLAERFGVGMAVESIKALPGDLDAAILALPHHLHRPMAVQLLQRGFAVFCEKPLATSVADANAMIDAATASGHPLGVGNIRRLYWSSREVKETLKGGALGRLQSVRIAEGNLYDWPTASGFFFDRAMSGGGVLMDTGAHVVDLLLWWLGESPAELRYADDDYGGVEAECLATFAFPSGVRATMQLSRLAKLPNRYVFTCEGGEIVYNPFDLNSIGIRRGSGRLGTRTGPARGFDDYFLAMLDDFFAAVRSGAPPAMPAQSVLPSIELIAACYEQATRLAAPWLEEAVR